MKSVADLLRDGDPLAADRELADDSVRHMRQVVLAHRAGRHDGSGLVWRGVAVLASIVVAATALGTWLADTRVDAGPARLAQVDRSPAPEPPARQVQFVTPRGTRVVWVLQADTSAQEGIR